MSPILAPPDSLPESPPAHSSPPSLRDARARHFAASGFSTADYRARWARVVVGSFVLVFPNWPGRARSLSLHDLHHALTGYATDLPGEAELAGWEVAQGCGRHWLAWILELQAFAFGLFTCPRRLFRAFLRGRHGKGNLYRLPEADALLLDSPLNHVRHTLGLDLAPRPATLADRLAFAACSSVALADGALAIALSLTPPAWLLYVIYRLAYRPDAVLAAPVPE